MIKFMPKPSKKVRKDADVAKPKANRLGTVLNVWIDTPLMEAFERYCANNRRTKTAEIEMAIEDKLRAAGMWPPKPIEDKQ